MTYHRLILILITVFPIKSWGAVDSSYIINYNINNGLPTNTAYSFIQDKYGYVWFATENGIVKYNGYTFRVFNTDDGLPSNDVWTLDEDKYDRIWLRNYSSELGYIKNDAYKKVNYDFKSVFTPQMLWKVGNYILIQYHAGDTMVNLYVTPEDRIIRLPSRQILLHNSQNRIVAYSIKTNKIFEFTSRNNKFLYSYLGKYIHTATSHSVTAVIISGNRQIGLTRGSNQIEFYNIVTGRKDSISLKKYGALDDEYVYSEHVTHGDTSFLLFTNKAIYKLSTDLAPITRIPFWQKVPSQTQVSYLLVDDNNNKWYASNTGVYLETSNYLGITQGELFKQGDISFAGMVSNGNTFWWKKKTNNIIIAQDKKIIKTIPFQFKKLYAVVEDHNGNIYLSADRCLLTYKGGKFVHIQDGKEVIFREPIKTNVIFDSTKPAGVVNENFKRVCFGTILHIQSQGQKLLLTSVTGNLLQLDIQKDTIINTRISRGRYEKSFFDSYNKAYWFYSHQSILYLDSTTNNAVTLSASLLETFGIRYIQSMNADNNGHIFICTSNRLWIYDTRKRNLSFVNVNFRAADSKMRIYNDLLIVAGKFGMAYSRLQDSKPGIFYIAPNTGTRQYNTVRNLVRNKNGYIYLDTDMGVYDYHVNELADTTYKFKGHDTKYLKLVLTKPYAHNINKGDTIHFNPENNIASLDFINFYGKGTRYYNFKIQGLSGWQRSTSGEIIVAGMKPGRYYAVYCYVADDGWQSNVYRFYIYKQPYWWQTTTWHRIAWIGAIFIFICFVLLVVSITRYYVIRANEKKNKLLDLELRAVHSQINPHFIFNSLSSALFFINRQNIEEAYTHVSKFSKLLRAYLKSSQERYVSLTEEIGMLKNYIELQQTRFESKFEYSVTTENKIPADYVKIPSLLLQPLVENAINHGLFHKKEGTGMLRISFTQGQTSDEIICTIEDNGVGRSKAAEIKNEKDAQRISYGSKLTQRLIDIFKEYEHMHIYLEYIDKTSPETGTIAKLTLKNLKYEA